jgi:hypothetical protein
MERPNNVSPEFWDKLSDAEKKWMVEHEAIHASLARKTTTHIERAFDALMQEEDQWTS